MQLKNLFKNNKVKQSDVVDADYESKTIEKPREKSRAEQISSIVSDGISDSDFGEMKSRLNNLDKENRREPAVFFLNNKKRIVLLRVLAIIFLLFILIEILDITSVLPYASSEYKSTITVYAVLFTMLFILDVIVLRKCRLEKQFAKRYRAYYDLMIYKRIVMVVELSDYTKIDPDKVIKDLNLAINKGLIPQGHIVHDSRIIILTDKLFYDYMSNRTAYDKYFDNIITEYCRTDERSSEIQKILDQGNQFIEKIQEDNNLIRDKGISDDLDEMKRTVTVIFRELDIDPSSVSKLRLFLEYYLPTTEKLLQTYIDLDKNDISGVNARKAKKEISDSLKLINRAYEGILDSFFEKREMEVSADISAMTTMMKQNGLIREDIKQSSDISSSQ